MRFEPNRLCKELSVLHDRQDGLGEESHRRRNPGPSVLRPRDSEGAWDGERFVARMEYRS